MPCGRIRAAHRSRRRGAQAGSASGPPQALMPAPGAALSPVASRPDAWPASRPAALHGRGRRSRTWPWPRRGASRRPAVSGWGGLCLAQGLRLASGAFPPAQDLRFGPGLLPLRASEAPFYACLARPELLLRIVSLFVSPSFPACVRNLLILNGRRGRTRTCDPLLRRQMLYPPELRARSAPPFQFIKPRP